MRLLHFAFFENFTFIENFTCFENFTVSIQKLFREVSFSKSLIDMAEFRKLFNFATIVDNS